MPTIGFKGPQHDKQHPLTLGRWLELSNPGTQVIATDVRSFGAEKSYQSGSGGKQSERQYLSQANGLMINV